MPEGPVQRNSQPDCAERAVELLLSGLSEVTRPITPPAMVAEKRRRAVLDDFPGGDGEDEGGDFGLSPQ